MAIDQKYGLVNIKGVPQDEPVFILRGQDAAAAEAILHYAEIAHRVGCEAEHVEHIMKSYKAVARWPVKKIPDTIIKKVTP
jgi:hypothetical protein